MKNHLTFASNKVFWSAIFPCLIAILAQAEDLSLVNFPPEFDVKSIVCNDSTATLEKSDNGLALVIHTGRNQPWPGVTIPSPTGYWDLSARAFLALQLKNKGSNAVIVNCRVDNPGADGTKHCVTSSLRLNPGQTNLLRVQLPHENAGTLGGKLFGMRGYPAAVSGPNTLDPKNITQLVIFVNQPKETYVFEISGILAGGTYSPPTAWVNDADPYLPFIDKFGQYRHKDWPGKVHSVQELIQKRTAEALEIGKNPGPLEWDQYGGFKNSPPLRSSGYFHTEKLDGKWWLVDPEGHLFWSHGIDCVRALDATPIEEREDWFENFPANQVDQREFQSEGQVLKGYYAGRSVKTFSFAGSNLKRKYGDHWESTYLSTIHSRLRSWGLNTIGNWSDSTLCQMHRTPYTDTIGSSGCRMIAGSTGYWGRFPDVFDPSFTTALRQSMNQKVKTSANDPWCIGYFSDNEMSWGDELSLALATLQSPADQPSKRELVRVLQSKYSEIAALNSAWGEHYASWESFLVATNTPDHSKARTDLINHGVNLARAYFRTVREAIKHTAPNQLYLGCRFAWVNDYAASAASDFCDVVSYNLYTTTVSSFNYPGADKPLLVGEFHFGALDRGLFHTGLVSMENQAARAAAYREFVTGALQHPQFIGTHWFQWQDEPTTGRVYDEENYQIGFVDVADTPYEETILTSRALGQQMYQIRLKR